VTGADLILHVRDIANPSTAAQKSQVLEVLGDLGVTEGEEGASIPIVEVWNKADLLSEEDRDAVRENAAAADDVVLISAVTGEGVDALLDSLGELLTMKARVHEFVLPASAGRKIAWLHAHGEVLEEDEAGAGPDGPLRRLAVKLNPKELGQFETL
jgi:GTP-binding protein HflX